VLYSFGVQLFSGAALAKDSCLISGNLRAGGNEGCAGILSGDDGQEDIWSRTSGRQSNLKQCANS
jgi:hypothetical protein